MIPSLLDILLALAIASAAPAFDICRTDDHRNAVALRFERLIMNSPTLRRQQ